MKANQSRTTIGLVLAMFGALFLTPDTLFMRLSQLDGWNMLVWRGGLSGLSYFFIWALVSGRYARPKVLTLNFGILVICQMLNAALFSLAIALAPVTVVLIGVATVPIFAAILSKIVLNEPLSKLTLITATIVFGGLFMSVLGKDGEGVVLDVTTVLGLFLGLGVAFALAMNFTIIRKDNEAPFVLAMAIGAIGAAALGLVFAEVLYWPPLKNMMAIAFTGICILPVSFVTLSYSARYVSSSTVSLIMLSETVLGPLWVWWGIGESPNIMMLISGAIVLPALAVFLINEGKRKA
ncbi:DMT family transporter [Pseudopelagicola sp. nBUS_20]|uniref:DMT family transporter n=1 Tax=Pseudopelagicola sp. nBUS_20 TaxID=3395317 RepID=UPI003EB6CDC6